jgi:GAF domain-containing protein
VRAIGIPLLLERATAGCADPGRREAGSSPPETLHLLRTFATQSALAIQNARLFRNLRNGISPERQHPDDGPRAIVIFYNRNARSRR